MLTNGEKELFAALMALRAETVDLVAPKADGGWRIEAQTLNRRRVEQRVDRLIKAVSKTLNQTKE